MLHSYYPIKMEISGSTALWTRPDTGDSPISYPVPTYSATKGIFESVLWGPDVEIIPEKVEICAPIRYHTYAFNYGGPLRKPSSVLANTQYQMYATVLTDVCYRLYAHVTPNHKKENLPESAKQWDFHTTSPGHAYQAIFNRRLNKGQSFSLPVLGWREFTPSYFGPFRGDTKVESDIDNIMIESMLRQVFPNGYASEVSYVFDNDVQIRNGVLIFPIRRKEYDQ